MKIGAMPVGADSALSTVDCEASIDTVDSPPREAAAPVVPGVWIRRDALPSVGARRSTWQAEEAVFCDLALRMARSPATILQSFSDAILSLTGAESAGVSVLENNGQQPEFRWLATSGRFAAHLGVTLPRDRSPCGVVLQENATMLIVDPARAFPEVDKLGASVEEVLLSPFQHAGVPVGTVWAVSHTPDKHFDQEDARLLDTVSRFASAAAAVVSQLQDSQRANRQLLAAAEQRRRGQSEVLATLAHELRNPLGTISNAFEVVRQSPTGETVARVSGIVERQLEHMSRLLDALLDGVRDEPGGVAPIGNIAMGPIVRSAVEMSAAEIASRRHELRLELADEELFVRGDATQFVEVVVNLLTNAAKYTDPGGRIVLSLGHDAHDVILQIADNGIGIAPDMLARIFEMFVQVNPPANDSGRSVGIGLAVAARLVGKHGGSVVATSAGLNSGSTFTVRLPWMDASS